MAAPLTQLKETWQRLKTGQRITVGVAAIATLGFIAALIIYGSQPEYGVLFSDLKPADAQTIVEKLKAANVPYTLSNNGTTVSVPSERVAEMRLQMASSGALSGGHVGFDLFDKNSFGATDFAQQVNYQRALEGELAKTIEGMDEIEYARVHLTQARESIFADKKERAKASVMVRVRQGRELSRERTEAISSLIASAIESLDQNDVSVMDTRGRLLSAPGSRAANEAGAFNSHLEARGKLESETGARIISLLEPITGAGHVRADVAADLDFSQVEQTEEKYDPKSAVIRSQQTTQESRGVSANSIGGITGTRANDPAAPAAAASAAAATSPANSTNPKTGAAVTQPATSGDQRAATTTNYEIDKTVKHTVGNGGRITRMSVSVVVDYKQANGVAVARTPEELKKIQDLVAAAVGVDASRGDQIVVQTIPFDQPTVEVANQSWLERYRDFIKTGIRYGALTLAALLLIIFVVRPARRALRASAAVTTAAIADTQPQLLPASHTTAFPSSMNMGISESGDSSFNAMPELRSPSIMESQMKVSVPSTVAQLEAQMEAEMEAEVARELNSVSAEAKRARVIKKQLLERAQAEPELVATALRGWLQES